jgi:hypothetical protein
MIHQNIQKMANELRLTLADTTTAQSTAAKALLTLPVFDHFVLILSLMACSSPLSVLLILLLLCFNHCNILDVAVV